MIELNENWKFLRTSVASFTKEVNPWLTSLVKEATGSSVWMERVYNIILKAFHV